MYPTLGQASIPNIKDPVMAAIRKLKVMPSDSTRYPRRHGSVHIFLLTSQVDDGAIDSLPEVFIGQIIHLHCIEPLFWVRNDIGSSGVFSVEHFRPEA